jgi:hypothetical protein
MMMQPRVSAGHHTPHHTVINCIPYATVGAQNPSKMAFREDLGGEGFPYTDDGASLRLKAEVENRVRQTIFLFPSALRL